MNFNNSLLQFYKVVTCMEKNTSRSDQLNDTGNEM